LNDLESQKEFKDFFGDFKLISRVNNIKMARDRLRQSALEIFNPALNVNFSSLSFDP